MGKQYGSELAALPATYEWAAAANIEALASLLRPMLTRSLLVVGSGGSLSGCALLARLHEQYARKVARVLTPLEFVLYPTTDECAVLLVSAGGSNPDILAAADHAIDEDFPVVGAIVAREHSRLAERLRKCRHATQFSFALPSGKDGFLATNTLLATGVLATRAYRRLAGGEASLRISSQEFKDIVHSERIDGAAVERPVWLALSAGWAGAAALDLESKVSESGLGSVTVTDYRNFAHGRHHGLALLAAKIGIISLESRELTELADRTLSVLPSEIPVVRLKTNADGPEATLLLLAKVFHLVGVVAAQRGIDPGRPQVPGFGRRLYHAQIPSSLRKPALSRLWLRRKVGAPVWANARETVQTVWEDAFERWRDAISDARFGGLVLDYDGTVCEPDERLTQPAVSVASELTRLVQQGLAVGLATGRGRSVLEPFRALVPISCWSSVRVGLYNGGLLMRLDEQFPLDLPSVPDIAEAERRLAASAVLSEVARFRTRATQVTVEQAQVMPAGWLRRAVEEALFDHEGGQLHVRVYESAHSVDIVPANCSKRHVITAIRADLKTRSRFKLEDKPLEVLCVGDQGRAGGNDFEFLLGPHSLSVEDTSTRLDSCWAIGPTGERRTPVLLRYLRALRRDSQGSFRFHVEELDISRKVSTARRVSQRRAGHQVEK
jgi:fructoselysine-6-P-deglycase FrlB-like protein/hydroxymethylpyrimidine pyrophosphatase-like HAD family hydrolase